jgi:hypothetical protein
LISERALISALRQIKDLAEEALNDRHSGRSRTMTKPSARPTSGGSLPDHLLRQRDRGFFKEPKTAAEVHTKLKSDYHCDINRVAVALLRLHKRKQLRRTSKTVGGKKQTAFVW